MGFMPKILDKSQRLAPNEVYDPEAAAKQITKKNKGLRNLLDHIRIKPAQGGIIGIEASQ